MTLISYIQRTAALALLGLGLTAPLASATFHEISIREVYPGSVAQPDAEYVELQMWASGQEFVKGHSITTFDATGSTVNSTPFTVDVGSGANQSTILIATTEAASQFGVAPDAAISPSGQLNPAGGAVCWESLDCVAWGNFSGSLPSPAGSRAAPGGIPDGQALRRTISPGCATLLEQADDRDDSATDFAAVFPAPRPNSVAPSERACAAAGGQQGDLYGPGRRGAPQTTLRRKPAKRTRDRTPTFRFSSDEPGSAFQCKLDRTPFKSCRSPFTAKKLTLGPHTFKVRARDESGRFDPSPASYNFKVIEKR